MYPRAFAVTDTGPEGEFVTEADWVPAFWNFLAGLDRDDIIAELVQNDLDQGATRTVISFEQDRLVCEGNGKPVDDEGWLRLRKIQGAGLTVPAKRGKIGVKNHGLKTAFTIGDEIQLLSAGKAISQTLYRNGRRKPPFPGASRAPKAHSQAPISGCRVIVSYRKTNLEPREGEAILLRAIREEEIESLFRLACANTPEQFAGIVSPEVARRYEIIIRHWRLGEAQFLLSCTRPQKAAKGIELFLRCCDVEGSASALPGGLREQAARRSLRLQGRLKERVPDFFRRGNRFLVEVSWRVDRRGKPTIGTGRFRYPIGYPPTSQEARTGHGLYYNAPVVSDTERHGPARNDATNDDLREACNRLAIDALAICAVPRWGAQGLDPLVPDGGAQDADRAVRPLLAQLARRGAIPVLTWEKAVRLLVARSTSNGLPSVLRLHLGGRRAGHQKYGFAIPVPRWKPNEIYTPLAVMCPRYEKQLDPRVHPVIIGLLTDGKTDGFLERFITFDENDALTRAVGDGNEYFDACGDRERDFADLLVAHSCLDVIDEAIRHGRCDAETEASLQAGLLLPDRNGASAPFKKLHTSAPLPSNIPGLSVPPILQKDIASHPIFERKGWRRPAYTIASFLESEALRSGDKQTRMLFWNWLCQNKRYVVGRGRSVLAALPIWPDRGGDPCTLLQLCEPRSRRAATILGESIRRPHETVFKSKLAVSAETGKSRVRTVPLQAEVSAWLKARMTLLVPGAIPDEDTAAALRRFEDEIAVLLKDAAIASVLKASHVDLPAIAQDGSLARRRELVMPDKQTNRLALPKRFMLGGGAHAAVLDRLSAPLSEPYPQMLMAAFKEDYENFAALQARLHAFLALTKLDGAYRRILAGLPILPVHGAPYAPRDLAFTGAPG